MEALELSSFGDFLLDGWVVQPRLNRISRGNRAERLEPRCMDLLVFLARHPTEVLSKERLIDEVWRVEAVASNTLTHEIAALRRALGDDARNPRYIETIHRRGYRLLIQPGPVSDRQSSISRTLSHYLLLEYLGGGGMGVVYRAEDTRLQREVALKFLPQELRRDATARERFVGEARAASALDHPNICTIHEIKETPDGQLYIVMAHYPGETLKKKIENGPLPVVESVRIAGQISDGLECAHREGIVHRDIKPANVMVTTDDEVKILDFGLAKLVRTGLDCETKSAESVPKTTPGRMIGTAAYMSPEQVRGEPADHRSDIFSLGVVLYEMLTGKRPFRGTTTSETAAAILAEDPEPVSSAVPGVPPTLDAVVSKCLEKRPEDRFSSTRDLALALGELESGACAPPVQHRPSVARRWPYFLAVGIAALMLWLAVRPGPGPSVQTAAGGPALDRSLLVIVPFENRTGDPDLDVLGLSVAGSISDELRGQTIEYLIASLGVEITEPTAARDTTSLLALASDHGAGTVLSGSVSRSGENLRLEARLSDAMRNGAGPAIEPVTLQRDNPEEAIGELRNRVSALVYWYLSTSHTILSSPKPPRWDSLREFRSSSGLPRLRRTLELDPDFHAAWYAVSVTYLNSGMWQEAIEALDTLDAHPEKLTPYGRQMSAALRAELNGEISTERFHLLRAREVEPRADLRRKIAFTAMALGRPLEAVELLDERLAEPTGMAPPGPRYFALSAHARLMLGQYEEAAEIAKKGGEIFPDSAWLAQEEAYGLAAAGRLEELDGLIDECRSLQFSDPEGAGLVMAWAVEALRRHGHRGEAQVVARRAVDWYRKHPSADASSWRYVSGLADALYRAEEWDDARKWLLELTEDVGDIKPVLRFEDARPLSAFGRLGVVAARLGDREEAERISALLGDVTGFTRGQPRLYQARIASLLGRGDRALDLLKQALSEGLSVADLLLESSDFETLWDDPGFRELVRPKG